MVSYFDNFEFSLMFFILILDVSNIEVPYFSFGQFHQPKRKVALVKSVHEQDDGTVFAICCTGCSTKDSLLSWIRLLEEDGNTSLLKIPVLFKFRSAIPNQLTVFKEQPQAKDNHEVSEKQ